MATTEEGIARWIGGHGPGKVLGPCPHGTCAHMSTSLVARGPSAGRYRLVECGISTCRPEGIRCRAWADEEFRIVTAWLEVELSGERAQ